MKFGSECSMIKQAIGYDISFETIGCMCSYIQGRSRDLGGRQYLISFNKNEYIFFKRYILLLTTLNNIISKTIYLKF